MGKKLILIFLALGVLLSIGAGCTNQGTSLYVNQPGQKTGTDLSIVDKVGWQRYENKKYGISFDYPTNWSKTETVSDDFLSVRLGSVECAKQCPPEFVGLEIRVGVKKGNFSDLNNWVTKKVAVNNETGLLPGGKVESVVIGGRSALKVEKSIWDGATPGPGYYINQDQYYYVNIATGRNDMTASAFDEINKIINSIAIGSNDLPVVDNDTGDDSGASEAAMPSSVRYGKVYTNNKFNFSVHYPEACRFVNNSDQVYPPTQLEFFFCGKDDNDKTISLKVVSSTVDAEVKNAFHGRRLKYYQNIILVSDHKGILVSFERTGGNYPERYIILEYRKWVYVLAVTNDTKDNTTNFDQILSGFELGD